MNDHHFAPASTDEQIVYGACRPGYASTRVSGEEVDRWIAFMKEQGIRRVVCLLEGEQIRYYNSLLKGYRDHFGAENVLHAPVPDYTLPSADLLLNKVLPFLNESITGRAKTVVHCSAGVGRTGFVLLTFLVVLRGLHTADAVRYLRAEGRDPGESGDPHAQRLLETCLERWGK